jgi:hypothetical protein
LQLHSGVIEILSQSQRIGEHGLGKALQATTSSLVRVSYCAETYNTKIDIIQAPTICMDGWVNSLGSVTQREPGHGVIVRSSLIISILAVVSGWMGSHDYLGFVAMSRAYVCAFLGTLQIHAYRFIDHGDDWWILARAEPYLHSLYLVCRSSRT